MEKQQFRALSSFPFQKVDLDPGRTVTLGHGEAGVWSVKPDRRMFEMEFDLKNDETAYLLYQVKLERSATHTV